MPAKIKVKVLAGRNLPVMDRGSDTTDAYVEIKFGGVTHKTDVCRKSLNPHWNSTEWYRFEVDESELQDEPLQLRLMDHDTYSANDAIGKVVVSLAPLLAREPPAKTAGVRDDAILSGWIPVFDTMHGIRGELSLIVKVELFSDFNKYKTSSCGVQFFHCPTIPPGYRAAAVHGFVEELVTNDDPEYQWIDKIRTPRASNEARQVAFVKLSNQVQRLVGLKAAELGANAVLGYQQEFDLQGEAGVVARAIGTAVNIIALPTPAYSSSMPPCSQQQLKKYLNILTNDHEDATEMNQYFQTHQDELQKLLQVLHPKFSSNFLEEPENDDDDTKSLEWTRHSSIKSYTDSVSIYQDDYVSQKSFRTLSKDQVDLNRLLNKDEEDSSSSGPMEKIKRIKTNFFSRRLASVRAKKEARKPSEDAISVNSNSSDASSFSLTDIKGELKKLKRIKKPKFRKAFKNPADQGVGMASILARSVIHAHTSLACIAESQDTDPSPSSTLRRTSESEPAINAVDDEESDKELPPKVPMIRFGSLKNVSGEPEPPGRERKISESCPSTPVPARAETLALPGEPRYFGSASSALSGDSSEVYSSSEADDESFERRADTDQSADVGRRAPAGEGDNLHVPDTLRHERARDSETTDSSSEQRRADTASEPFVAKKPLHFSFHNPFTHKNSVSAPSSPVENDSFVYRSSRRIKRQLSRITNSDMIKSLSHYTLSPRKRVVEQKSMSQPGSSSDVQSKAPSETVLGAPFLSYTDLLSLDKDAGENRPYAPPETAGGKVKMYIGSEPISRASLSGPSSPLREEAPKVRKEKLKVKSTGLLHTAMETILLDKVQSLLIPTSPEVSKEQRFFDDVTERLAKEAQQPIPISPLAVSSAVNSVSGVCGNKHAGCACRERGSPPPHARHESCGREGSLTAPSPPHAAHRRSSDSDLSITPKGGSLNASANTSCGGAILRPSMTSANLEILEHPFLTLTDFPSHFIVHIGGTVSARSVKLVDSADSPARWAELRTEVRAHARALRCNAVVGYSETYSAICEDVVVYSASGTAAVIDLDCDLNADLDAVTAPQNGVREERGECAAAVCHAPYSPGAGHNGVALDTCRVCRRGRVPPILLATCSKPAKLKSVGKAIVLTAVAARVRKQPPQSEPAAREVSDHLPFLQYELHKLLLAKLRVQGANAIFNLQVQIALGERCTLAFASGTAFRLLSLPPPLGPPDVQSSEGDKEAAELRRALRDAFAANVAANGYDAAPAEVAAGGAAVSAGGADPPPLELNADKETIVLQLDEAEDVETARALCSPRAEMAVQHGGLRAAAAPPQAFAQVWRARFPLSAGGGGPRGAAERHVRRALAAAAHKLRRAPRAAVVAAAFRIDLPEDEIQLVFTGTMTQLAEPAAAAAAGAAGEDDIFSMDEEVAKVVEPVEDKFAVHSPMAVTLTSAAAVGGSRHARRVCALRLLFVRETTALREAGGVSGFLHTVYCEVMAVVRAHTAALGGNALTSFYLTPLMLQDSAHKNQGQCLLSIGGDVVHVIY